MEYKLTKPREKRNISMWEGWEEIRDCIMEKPVDYIVEEKEVHNKHDKSYKYLLSVKKNFIDLIKTFTKIELNEEIEDRIFEIESWKEL